MKARPLSKEEIQAAMTKTRSVKAAARYLHCSYQHLKKWMKLFRDEDSGLSLFDLHKNQAGKGIAKHTIAKGKEPLLNDLIEGRVSIDSYSPEKLKNRLLLEGHLVEHCYKCGFHEQRLTDLKTPLLLSFKDKNKKNWNLNNLEMLCYNCYFLYAGDVFNNKQVKAIEDYITPAKKNEVTWELDDWQIEHFKELGLMEDEKPDDGSEFISRL